MPLSPVSFTPVQGLRDVTAYPTNPGSEAAARDQIQKGMDQLRDWINVNLLNVAQIASGSSKIQSGATTVTVATTGTISSAVTFPSAFGNIPLVFLQVVDAAGATNWFVWANLRTPNGFNATINATTTGNYLVQWFAIGS